MAGVRAPAGPPIPRPANATLGRPLANPTPAAAYVLQLDFT
jgi:hypothetical protein